MKNVELVSARNASGKTQRQVATEVKITEQHYQKYEYGERRPRADMAIRIAEAVGITSWDAFKRVFGAGTPER